ncbi:hypothetical protein KSP40_PGU004981 [Platanthera guangdongensis]|uniref:SWIM-type domain-containing protein n=1 Tax=Platanthera guangdongensis TaxID=2320717 RepID=A0ABR2M2N3_9ASPA
MWRIRRSWLRNVVSKCSNIEDQREIFKCLGKIIHSIWNGVDYTITLGELLNDFAGQTAFIKVPLASQESCGAIEGYHVKLKLKIYEDSQLDSLERVDWLVHKLTMETHSSYWLDLYADESGSFPAVQEEYISSTSWHRALQIPDGDVTLDDDQDRLFAKIASQKDRNCSRVVSNPGSEFTFCDCSWSAQGNLCKHVIKANMICEQKDDHPPSFSRQAFQQLLNDLSRKPIDDSIELDQSHAWAMQMHEKIQRLVELTTSSNIATVANDLPVKWAGRKGRTLIGKPAEGALLLRPISKNNVKRKSVSKRKSRKRKRLRTLQSIWLSLFC